MKLLTVTSGPTWPGNAPLPDVGTGVGTVIFRPVSRVASGTGTTIGESIARLVVTAQGTVELRGTDYVPFQLWGGVPADGSVEAPIYDVEEYLHLDVGTPQERAAVQSFRIQPYETVGDGIPEGTWNYRTVPKNAVRYVAGPEILQAFEEVKGGRVILADAEAARLALLDGATGFAALTALLQPALDEMQGAIAAANSSPYATLTAAPAPSTNSGQTIVTLDTGAVYRSDGSSYGLPLGYIVTPSVIDALRAQVSAVQAAQQGGVIGYTTRAALDADLAHPAGTVGQVTQDVTAANNTTYLKIDASGSGSWIQAFPNATTLGNNNLNLVIAEVSENGRVLRGYYADGTLFDPVGTPALPLTVSGGNVTAAGEVYTATLQPLNTPNNLGLAYAEVDSAGRVLRGIKVDGSVFDPLAEKGPLLIALGDSFTFGYVKNAVGADSSLPADRVFGAILARRRGWAFLNRGSTGTTVATGVANSMVSRYQTEVNQYNPAHVTVFGGHNDLNNSIPLGSSANLTDTSTFWGALYTLLKGILDGTSANVTVMTMLVRPFSDYTTPSNPDALKVNAAGFTAEDYRSATRDVVSLLHQTPAYSARIRLVDTGMLLAGVCLSQRNMFYDNPAASPNSDHPDYAGHAALADLLTPLAI
ncbi:SGNH/GDSL hydrolase family protein [uncultured Deinococcus sp.]|uniref:SGNH/GDSL hydrolase family protein n=1 Tax=uncultured Deinococcus sp. TaxID=158789 RepID=UPI0025DAEFB3|nr:SGNH/GDSL hydrolase family protein [uncultured Deinococcus sp.]